MNSAKIFFSSKLNARFGNRIETTIGADHFVDRFPVCAQTLFVEEGVAALATAWQNVWLWTAKADGADSVVTGAWFIARPKLGVVDGRTAHNYTRDQDCPTGLSLSFHHQQKQQTEEKQSSARDAHPDPIRVACIRHSQDNDCSHRCCDQEEQCPLCRLPLPHLIA